MPIGNEFDSIQNVSRNSKVFEKFRSAFAAAIPSDALSIELSDNAQVYRSDIFIDYVVAPGPGLYYREEDENNNQETRPYYPGIIYSWNCNVIGRDRMKPYTLNFTSKPAEHFQENGSGVYDAMANSAFEDLESNLSSLVKNSIDIAKRSSHR